MYIYEGEEVLSNYKISDEARCTIIIILKHYIKALIYQVNI